MGVEIARAGLEHVDMIAPLFDGYRQFYGQEPDLPGANRFLGERLANQQSVVFLAHEPVPPLAGLGFVQLYPSFSSVRMRPI